MGWSGEERGGEGRERCERIRPPEFLPGLRPCPLGELTALSRPSSWIFEGKSGEWKGRKGDGREESQ